MTAAMEENAAVSPTAIRDRFLTLNEVSSTIGFSASWIYDRIKRGEFPAAFKVGGCSNRWSEQDISAWMQQQKQQRAA